MTDIQQMGSNSDTGVLLERWHQGDLDALNVLIGRSREWIDGVARRQLGPALRRQCDTQDIVQESLLDLVRYRPPVAPENRSQFRTLLARIVQRVVEGRYEWHTRQRRNMKREGALPETSYFGLDASIKEITRPDVAASRKEDRALVRLALGLLSVDDRDIVLRRHFEGEDFETMGQQLGVTPDTARKRFARALPRLFEILTELRQKDSDGERS